MCESVRNLSVKESRCFKVATQKILRKKMKQLLLNNLLICLFMLRLLGNKPCLEQCQFLIYWEILVVLNSKLDKVRSVKVRKMLISK